MKAASSAGKQTRWRQTLRRMLEQAVRCGWCSFRPQPGCAGDQPNGSANEAGKERKDQFCAHADTFRLSAGRIARSLPPVISSAWYCRPPGTPVFAHSQTLAGLTPRRRATSACEPNSSMRSCSVIARILGLPKSKRNTFFARRLGKPKKVLALHLWKP